jgi:hypothetical protein
MTTTTHSANAGAAPPREPSDEESTASGRALDEAVRAVTVALAALNADPAASRVEESIGRAGDLLEGLEPGLTAIVLNRLLTSIRDCHREGRQTSAQLRARRASAARALHLDPRRHSHPTRKAS